jgi:hypothetical protein
MLVKKENRFFMYPSNAGKSAFTLYANIEGKQYILTGFKESGDSGPYYTGMVKGNPEDLNPTETKDLF